MKTAVLLALVALTAASPFNEPIPVSDVDTKLIDQLNEEQDDEAFKQNFKDVLAEYVFTEEKDLTATEREKIKTIIDDLLQNIVRDFSVIVDMEDKSEVKRFGDTSFEDIQKCIVLSVPDIAEYNRLRLAQRLEKNVLIARQKLDRVILESKEARFQNS